jgi:serine/threonine protein kinase
MSTTGEVKKREVRIGKYVKVKKLGQGTYGRVYLCKHADSGKLYVLKEVDLSMLKPFQQEQAVKEIRFLNSFRHPCIIGYDEYFQVKYKGHTILYIVMEYADSGDLGHVIKRAQETKKFLPEEQVLDWLVQLCLALKHIHDRKIIHRDLKSENVFLMRDKSVRLGDFGVARDLASTLDNAKTQVGTPYYLSPEICQNNPYNHKTDVWALGAIMYELLALRHPFEAKNLHELVLKIVGEQQPALPRMYSKDLRQIVDRMLLKDTTKRPTIAQLLQEPVIAERIPRFLDQEKLDDEFSHTILHGEFNLAGLIKQKEHEWEASERKERQVVIQQRLQTQEEGRRAPPTPVPDDHSRPPLEPGQLGRINSAPAEAVGKRKKQPRSGGKTRPRTQDLAPVRAPSGNGGMSRNSSVSSLPPNYSEADARGTCMRCDASFKSNYFKCDTCQESFLLCSSCLSRSRHDPSHNFSYVPIPRSQRSRGNSPSTRSLPGRNGGARPHRSHVHRRVDSQHLADRSPPSRSPSGSPARGILPSPHKTPSPANPKPLSFKERKLVKQRAADEARLAELEQARLANASERNRAHDRKVRELTHSGSRHALPMHSQIGERGRAMYVNTLKSSDSFDEGQLHATSRRSLHEAR